MEIIKSFFMEKHKRPLPFASASPATCQSHKIAAISKQQRSTDPIVS